MPLISSGDSLEIAVNLYSMRGLMDPNSISWDRPFVAPRPEENALNYVKEKISFFSGRKNRPPV